MPTDSLAMHIAIYGDVNANIMDGSSIWLRNIAKLCSGVPNAQVDLFLKAPIERWQVLDELCGIDNISIIEPEAGETEPDNALSASNAIKLIRRRARQNSYTAVILRGMELCREAALSEVLSGRIWSYLTDIPQRYSDVTEEKLISLNDIVESSRYVLCQTEEMRNFLGNIIRDGHHKLVLLPPMVPDEAFFQKGQRENQQEKLKVFYSGKFAPAWAVGTLVDLSESVGSLSITIAGDKFHRVPSDPEFKIRLENKFSTSTHVDWLGALTPGQVFEQMRSMQLGYAWRDPEMDESLELSTKLLEYGAAGLAVITNPTPAHKALLGEDYPFFASDKDNLEGLIKSLPQRTAEIEEAGELCRRVARQFSFGELQIRFNALFSRVYRDLNRSRTLKVVLAGHDLKFARELIEYFESRVDIELKIDYWRSLREHDEYESKKLAEWADIVFCEWCAGNAVWYSENINPSKTNLFIRFHRIEILMEFAPKVRMEAVEKVLFVGPHFLRQAREKFSWPMEKLSLLPNFVDTEMYRREKFKGAEFNLGLIGFVPRLKRLDRALDILKELRKKDKRYTLFIKGRFPWEYPWIWRKDEEREFYEECFRRIREDDDLSGAVVFDPFGNDVALWLRKIGVILSVSDIESFHMALAEGIASGAYPLLWKREGVDELFPWLPSADCPQELAEALLRKNEKNQMILTDTLVEKYDMQNTILQLDELIT
ncbi:glycosyltransferase family 1 protein [Halomonas sp. ML-15]|uniref:glycosyltransferase family 1 protein n=1 Tax=Halomonas sp. ML-15 TaxID=2773305 RepID=UPI0017474DE8|nr:glycosyltransferase family 1 protein [Halomonas sp. ML-15]MBD3896229.1 glycosyltransferase family 1 protein [Halomonas sp. ML-15]